MAQLQDSRRCDHVHVPHPIAEPLLPFIRTRQEALDIRRTITHYLKTQIVAPGGLTDLHTSLGAGNLGRVEVKDVPTQLGHGKRAELLKALKANVTAKKEYQRLLKEVVEGKTTTEVRAPDDAIDAPTKLQTYLSILRNRHEKERFEVFKTYVDRLNGMTSSQHGYLALSDEQAQISKLSQDLAGFLDDGEGASTNECDDVEQRLSELEAAVIRAKQELFSERKRIGTLRERLRKESTATGSQSPLDAGRVQALLKTRDELVRWVEESLAVTTIGDARPVADDTEQDNSSATELIKTGRIRIMAQYGAYLEARKELLSAVADFLQPLLEKQSQSQSLSSMVQAGQVGHAFESTLPDIASIYSYTTRNLLLLSHARAIRVAQGTHLQSSITKENRKTLRMLDRLQEESHLLHEYPITDKPKRQLRHSRTISLPEAGQLRDEADSRDPASEIVARSEAWVFAASKAQASTKDVVSRQIGLGMEALQSGEDASEELYRMLNAQEVDGGQNQDGKPSGRRKSASENAQPQKASRGPWAKLKGNVGVS